MPNDETVARYIGSLEIYQAEKNVTRLVQTMTNRELGFKTLREVGSRTRKLEYIASGQK